ncbi:MAG: hypothetical protein KDA99_03835 [Planctomycetales bacterium]|nr:hypothetical protein [Planctomycetales bacterium]
MDHESSVSSVAEKESQQAEAAADTDTSTSETFVNREMWEILHELEQREARKLRALHGVSLFICSVAVIVVMMIGMKFTIGRRRGGGAAGHDDDHSSSFPLPLLSSMHIPMIAALCRLSNRAQRDALECGEDPT